MRLWLLAVGGVALLAQVVLLRELEVASFGSELVVVLGLGVWLLGTAAGAAWGRRAHLPREGSLRRLFLALGLLVPAAAALARGGRRLLGGVPGAYLPLIQQLLLTLACLAPAAFLLGLLFQGSAKRYAMAGGSAAGAYAVESAGGLAGGLLATALPALGVQNSSAALLAAAGAFAAAAWRPRRGPGAALLGGAGAALALLGLAAGPALDRLSAAWNHPGLLATRDTPYARVTLAERLGQLAVFENDALAYESEGTAAEEFVHLAAVQREAPARVLVLGGAAQGLIPEVLKHRPARVVDVELDGRALALVAAHLPAGQRAALSDPRVKVVVGDPRRLLERPGGPGMAGCDLLLCGLPEPESGRTNRYYTREFFARCARLLAPDGVLALRLRSQENLWTPVLARRAAGVERALRGVFHDVVVLPGTTNLFLASAAPLSRDPAELGRRLAARRLEARRVTPAYIRYLYTNDRTAEIRRLLASTAARANRDARPSCYQATMLLWLARFYPPLARLDLPEPDPRALLRSPGAWLAAAALAAALLLARRRAGARRALLAGASGFAGMALEAALLLQYQTVSGVLYQDLGALLMAFMAGLAAGAWAMERWMRGAEAAPGAAAAAVAPSPRARRAPGAARGRVALAAFFAFACGGALLLRAGAAGGLAATAALLAACGFLVAAAFAYAVLRGAPEARAVVGPVYAADVLGGCLGSLAAGLVLIPMLGLPATALAAAGGCAAALL
ncbi:MAG TPA: hypothetical protein VMS93_04035, partial [Candidatus Saccharimonadales bacterium]|nr:hypothetical protein [Candidatus Saccharimonadales bacterium]